MNATGQHRHLEAALIRLRTRIRRIQWLRGTAQCLALLLFALLILILIDLRFALLPTATRWAMLVVWLGLGVATAWLRLVRPLSQPLTTVRLARWLETRHPELDERASTVLELDEGHGTTGVSALLLDDLAVEAARDLDIIEPTHEVSIRKTRPWLIAVGVLVAAWLVLFVAWPERTARHLVRVLAPASDLGTAAGRILVAPGDADVMEGNPVEIRAQVKGKPFDAPLEIVLVMDDGAEVLEPMSPTPDGAVFRLEKAERNFAYQVRAGRETSDRHRITVWPLPRLVDPRVRLEFPAYTGLAPREIGLGDTASSPDVSATAGTRAELRAGLNTPVESARMEIDGVERGEIRMDRGADGGRLEIAWPMENPGVTEARVVLDHLIGGEFEALRFQVNTLPDTAPKVHWLTPTQDKLHLRPDDTFPFTYEATDDIGLAGAVLEIDADPDGGADLPLSLPDRVKRLVPATWRGEGEQAVGALLDRWPKARNFRIRVRVRDNRTPELGGPNTSATKWKQVVIDRNAPALASQELMAQHSEVRETIEKARRDTREAQRRLDAQRRNVAKDDIPEQTRKELARARKQLAEARDSLRDLAERMRESVHAADTPEMERAAEKLTEALQHAEDAPLSDEPELREREITAAQDAAREAAEQLERLREEIQREESRIRDLAKLRELEQQQRELARKASAQASQPDESPQSSPPRENPEAPGETTREPDSAWQQAQQQTAAKIQQEARERPESRAAALEEQARQARALAVQAAEQANTQRQLAEATPEANQQNNGENTEANNTESATPESQSAREALRDALTRKQKRAESMAGAEALEDLAENQQALAEAIDAFAKGNETEARAALAELAAQQADRLAEDIAELPQVDGPSSPMRTAAQSSQAGAQQAQQAADAASKGESQSESPAHQNASERFDQSAEALANAAENFASQATSAANQSSGKNKAPAPGAPMAQAFAEAAQAAAADSSPQAAAHAQQAAEALSQAAQSAMRAMQGRGSSKGQGQQAQKGQNNQEPSDGQAEPSANQAQEGYRTPQADPGVPPELAKLGISTEDWAKIKTALKSETGNDAEIQVPEEYRTLVRQYFEQMAEEK